MTALRLAVVLLAGRTVVGRAYRAIRSAWRSSDWDRLEFETHHLVSSCSVREGLHMMAHL